MIKKLITLSLTLALCALAASAQDATAIFNKTVKTYRNSGAVSATYTTGGQRGTIVLNGSAFRVLQSNFKTWFDGKTQWTWSSGTGEVNVTTPTAQEISQFNPLSVANSLRQAYSMSVTSGNGPWTLTLIPRKAGKVKKIVLHINKQYHLTGAKYVTTGGTQSFTLTNYKVNANYPASTFKFDKKLVPSGTEVVDLR